MMKSTTPENIRFGTSSWNYEGWKGIIYTRDYKSNAQFKREALAEYAQNPLFRTVGIDSSFYGPPAESTIRRYSEQVPEDFLWVSKVWEEITVPIYANHSRYGAKAGKENPNFLNPELFCDSVLSTYERNPAVAKHAGPFVFQFQTFFGELASNPQIFFDKLAHFLEKLPTKYLYATEVRNKHFLSPDYFSVINQFKVAHCFNHWTSMPALEFQMKAAAAAGGLKSEHLVSRILTPLGVSYQQAVKRFEPYQELKAPNPQMRSDIIKLCRRAIQRGSTSFIIVNNRSEGHSPGTIKEVSEALAESLKNNPIKES